MSKKKNSKNLGLGITFLLFFIVLIFASVSLKIFFLFSDARFDGKHRFNVLFSSGSNSTIVSFCPECSSLAILKIKDNKNNNKNIAKNLLAPVDAELSGDLLDLNSDVSTNLIKSLFSFGSIKSDLNTVDLVRLIIFSKTVSDSSIISKNISLKDSSYVKESVMSSVFSDPTIISEKSEIEIVNGTGVSGLGNRLAGLISNMGGAVVLVRNSDKLLEKSEIRYINNKNYTLQRLGRLLDISIEKSNEKSIAEAVILIGKDSLLKEKF